MRSWRAEVATRHAEHVKKAQHLTELSKDLAALPETRRLLETRTQALVIKEQEQAAADSHRVEVELASQRAGQTLAEETERLKECSTQKQLLEWLRTTKPHYIETTTQERKLSQQLDAIAVQLGEQRAIEEKLTIDLQAAETDAIQAAARSTSMQEHLRLLNSILDAHPHYVEHRHRLEELDVTKRKSDQEIADLQLQLRKCAGDQTALTTEEKRLETVIKHASAQQSEFKRLLSDLAGHIHSGVCPLCAADYSTKENLLGRIQSHANAEVASEVQQQLQGVRQRLEVTQQALTSLAARKASAEQRSTGFQAEKTQIEAALKTFQKLIEGTGLLPDSPVGDFLGEIRRRIEAMSTDISRHDAALGQRQRSLASSRDSLAACRQSSPPKAS